MWSNFNYLLLFAPATGALNRRCCYLLVVCFVVICCLVYYLVLLSILHVQHILPASLPGKFSVPLPVSHPDPHAVRYPVAFLEQGVTVTTTSSNKMPQYSLDSTKMASHNHNLNNVPQYNICRISCFSIVFCGGVRGRVVSLSSCSWCWVSW